MPAAMSDPAGTLTEKNATGWFSGYRRNPGRFDEFLQENGDPRPHYQPLLDSFGPEPRLELKRRQDDAERLVREHGITYTVYDDPLGTERPWQLDAIPLAIAPDEWRQLEAGLVQRATLLNGILADCYGKQDLIRSKGLPPALVFAQPDFLRPCHGIRPPGDTFLHFYTADLVRSPNGRWWVVSDRTQIPTGAGYALANRLVTARITPSPFRERKIRRLAGFFREVQNGMQRLAPRRADKARVVMLTPGPHNETYFEQAYLARYLGYTLVEGSDLTVRDNHVFLKTLSGLERVDVLVRRVDDDFCDPLELRNDSILGVPGLVEAIRAGHVVVANALGTGIVQSPAFMAFLPGLCRHILGEELKLPSVATWWCGQKGALEYVREHLDELALKPAFRTLPSPAFHSANSGATALDREKRRLEFNPALFVAQEQVEASAAPAFERGELVARPVGLRVFLAAAEDGYRVMPGGLARISPSVGARFVSMQQGGSSKDVWVLSESDEEEPSLLLEAGHSVELRRTGNNLPSRLADNFFWLGRYAERADATARLLRSVLQRLASERSEGSAALLAPLVQTLISQGQLSDVAEDRGVRDNPEAFEAALLAAIFDPSRPASLRNLAGNLRRLAVLVRDRTSHDMWRALREIDDRLSTPTTSLLLAGDAVELLNRTLLGLAAFHGLARENMTRAQGWRFLDMGLRLERALYVGTLLDVTLHCPAAENPSLLEAVLEIGDSSLTYRSRYNLLTHAPGVFDLLLLDNKNPRSVLFQVNQLVKHFGHLPGGTDDSAPGRPIGILRECAARLEGADARELARPQPAWPSSKVRNVLHKTLHDLPRLSNAISASYFAHSAISRTGGEADS
jgi:uncharacterized circularly permuted ATP-grasp superfamily protein/uncharacterized alpha-E superfamily protein